MDELINWALISRKLTGDSGAIRSNYTEKRKPNAKYYSVISDIKEIAKLIDMRIENFKEPKGLSESIIEIEETDKIKETIQNI